ncbi:MAG: hypothetical protein IT445_08765 [Phycisphaeraceae bacterium]|nr:hypothetical protein [Phycisphaeraceae bacterium]
MRRHFGKQQIRELSGEQLLLLAIFGNSHLRSLIQHEQARRSQVCQRMQRFHLDRLSTLQTHAARAA